MVLGLAERLKVMYGNGFEVSSDSLELSWSVKVTLSSAEEECRYGRCAGMDVGRALAGGGDIGSRAW